MGTGEQPAPPTPRFPFLGPGVAGVASFLAFAALLALPMLGVLVAFLAPLPLAHLASGGRPSIMGWGWVAVVLAGVGLVSGAGVVGVVLTGYLMVAAWPAVSAEFWARRRWATGRWTAVLAAVPLAWTSLLLFALASPGSPVDLVQGALASAGQEGIGRWSALVPVTGSEAEELVRWSITLVAYLVPALVTMYVVAVGMWLRRRLPLVGFPVGSEPFCDFRSEEWLPAAFVAGALGWVFLPGAGKWLAGNLLAVVVGLYFLHGLAIILFHLGRRFGENRWVRLAVVLFGLQLPVAAVVATLGLFDTFVALRRGERRE